MSAFKEAAEELYQERVAILIYDANMPESEAIEKADAMLSGWYCKCCDDPLTHRDSRTLGQICASCAIEQAKQEAGS